MKTFWKIDITFSIARLIFFFLNVYVYVYVYVFKSMIKGMISNLRIS